MLRRMFYDFSIKTPFIPHVGLGYLRINCYLRHVNDGRRGVVLRDTVHACACRRLYGRVIITIKREPSIGSWPIPVPKREERQAIQGGLRVKGKDQAAYHYHNIVVAIEHFLYFIARRMYNAFRDVHHHSRPFTYAYRTGSLYKRVA